MKIQITNNTKISLLAVVSLIIGACSSGGSGGPESVAKAPTLSEDKIKAVTQSQALVTQFSEDVKSSKQSKSNKRISSDLASAFILGMAQSNGNSSSSKPTVQAKSSKMHQKIQSANCTTQFKAVPKTSEASADEYVLEISGAKCPMRLKQSVQTTIQNNGKNMSGKINFEYESLDTELTKETDIKNMNIQGSFALVIPAAGSRQSASLGDMKMDFKYEAKGETLSVGGFTVSMNLNMDMVMSADQSVSSQISIKKLLLVLSSRVTVADELGTLYVKSEMIDNKTVSDIAQVNGVNVSKEKFSEVLTSMLAIPGFNSTKTGESESSSTNRKPSPPSEDREMPPPPEMAQY